MFLRQRFSTLFLRIVDYLRGYQEQGYLYGDIWGEEDVREVERILDNPDLFLNRPQKRLRMSG